MQDDMYEGVFLPKGSVIVPNVWYVLNCPKDPPRAKLMEASDMWHGVQAYAA